MPYGIRKTAQTAQKRKRKYIVYKKHGGQVIGHTTSRRKATKMISAIYMHEHGLA